MAQLYSDNMKHIIRNIGDGLPVFSGITGRSRQGASQATLRALVKRGVILLNPRALETGQQSYVLTAHGKEAYKFQNRYREDLFCKQTKEPKRECWCENCMGGIPK